MDKAQWKEGPWNQLLLRIGIWTIILESFPTKEGFRMQIQGNAGFATTWFSKATTLEEAKTKVVATVRRKLEEALAALPE